MTYSQAVLSKGLSDRLGCHQSLHEIHDPQVCPNLELKAVNEIHSLVIIFITHLTLVTVSEGLNRGLMLPATSELQTLNFCSLPTLNSLTTVECFF